MSDKKELEYPFMDDGSRLSWIIAVILLLGAIFFAAAETAFTASSRPRLKALSELGNKKAEKALEILDNYDKAISTMLICTNIIHLSIASIVTIQITKQCGLNAVAVSTIITTLVVFFAGEMLPKTLAKRYAEPCAMECAGVLSVFMTIFTPLSALLSTIGNFAAKHTKGEHEISVTEDELYDILEDMTEEGTLKEEQSDLISSAIGFNDLTVESVLTPRMDVVAVNIDDSPEKITAIIKSCTHSRLPVYEGNIDNIVGILSIKKYLKQYLKKGTDVNIKSILSAPCFIHQSTKIDDLLPVMSKNRQSVAIVTDNYGGTLGIVTVEDMVEELVGEIWDEEDVVEEPIKKISDNEVSADADEHVADVFDALDIEVSDDEEFDDKILGAWVLETFDRIPKTGDTFRYKNLEVTVSEMEHNRIKRVNVRCER